jgi:hypothetical protein
MGCLKTGRVALAAAVLRGAVGAEAARSLAGDLRAAGREVWALLGGLARPKQRTRERPKKGE